MTESHQCTLRHVLVMAVVFLCFLGVIYRLVFLTVWQQDFLRKQGDSSMIRMKKTPADRGSIVDRFNRALAISVPVSSVWIHPKQSQDWTHADRLKVAKILGVSEASVQKKIRQKSHFVYLKRRISPSVRDQLVALSLPGLHFVQEPKRYYPMGEVIAPVLGFTGVNDHGLEGLEVSYDAWLSGAEGVQIVEQDPAGHVLAVEKMIHRARPGKTLVLSIDHRLQTIAYQALSEGVKKAHASSGSAVVLSPKTGEILAMANYPSFNPNHLSSQDIPNYRNRALADTYEPGSVFKPIALVSVLSQHDFTDQKKVWIGNGRLHLDGHTITDAHKGPKQQSIDEIIKHSSNVGIAKLAMMDPPHQLQTWAHHFGFGRSTSSGFPGEASGFIKSHLKAKGLTHASFSFGYGVSATNLQIAQAFSVFANHGRMHEITFLKTDKVAKGQQVISARMADRITRLLTHVVDGGGTGRRARVQGVSVAGKTGTAYLVGKKGYDHHQYLASFVGYAPAEDAKLVVSVFIVKPNFAHHFGGQGAAPVVQSILSKGLRRLKSA